MTLSSHAALQTKADPLGSIAALRAAEGESVNSISISLLDASAASTRRR